MDARVKRLGFLFVVYVYVDISFFFFLFSPKVFNK